MITMECIARKPIAWQVECDGRTAIVAYRPGAPRCQRWALETVTGDAIEGHHFRSRRAAFGWFEDGRIVKTKGPVNRGKRR